MHVGGVDWFILGLIHAGGSGAGSLRFGKLGLDLGSVAAPGYNVQFYLPCACVRL